MQRPLQPVVFTLSYTMPLMLCLGITYGGGFYFLVSFFVFGLLPIMDFAFGTYTYNADEPTHHDRLKNRRFKWGGALLCLCRCCWWWAGLFGALREALTLLEQTGLLLSVALCTGGMGITLAHEFAHQPKGPERLLSKILLLCVLYAFFYRKHRKTPSVHGGDLCPSVGMQGVELVVAL